MQAIILAAGMGKRLGEFTKSNTKCMVKVNGVTLIERLLQQLDNVKSAKLNRIVIVTGYEGQKLRDYVATLNVQTTIEYVDNPIYASTNNIYSLWLAKDYLLQDDTLLFESDLIFEDEVVEKLLTNPYPSLALVSKYESWMDGTVVKLGENYEIDKFIPGTEFRYEECASYYKTVNIYKFSRRFSNTHYVPFLEAYSKALGNNEYYEQVLRVITLLDKPEIKALPLNGESWYEIDDVQDLDIAESIFCPSDEKLERMGARLGGFWRYPRLLDFCYFSNSYFPNERMMSELKANFENMARSYPSGMRVNNLLGGKYFGVRSEYVCMGNGVAELINALLKSLQGKIGVLLPMFETYLNCLDVARVDGMSIEKRDLTYTVDEIMSYYADKDISALLLMNPSNPAGNCIPVADLLRLSDWTVEKGCRLIVDESFVDFAEGGSDNVLMINTLLEQNSGLVVMRSISEASGVPGLRLGILASADTLLIDELKKNAPLWNINSLGEFYMQIFGKYEKHYRAACLQVKHERERLMAELAKVPFLRVLPSQANYFVCEVLSPFTANELTKQLLTRFNILVKEFSSESQLAGREFIRIAVRDTKDNNALVAAISHMASGKVNYS
ncbi:MAG: aminotransferase class I/II-fold pyridoxal phosphate-dependent enzyme [Akkermansia sp.]|nr:aminotransferase class I/II-fold pyridoxal phosphate-dependent enzyme [Akkermansia sp.]